MLKLHPVKITKTMSCLTYALTRAGINIPSLTDTADIEEYFELHPITYLLGDNNEFISLAMGTLLLFCNNERTDLVPMEITEDGIIITKPTMLLRHVAVYEDNQMISDCGISSKNYPFCKHVRMRRISEISASYMPTHVLALKSKYQHCQQLNVVSKPMPPREPDLKASNRAAERRDEP